MTINTQWILSKLAGQVVDVILFQIDIVGGLYCSLFNLVSRLNLPFIFFLLFRVGRAT